jgi:O-antigen/teichoic acid export membrane protein
MISLFRRGAVGLVDQGMSSLSNVLAIIMVAQSLSASAFGSFSVAYAVLIFLLTLTRSYFGTQLTLTDTRSAAGDRASSTLGALLLLAPLLAVATGGIGLLLSSEGDFSIALVVALAAPLVCLQDLLRYTAVAVERPIVALASDTVWAAVMAVPAFGLIRLTGAQVMVVWLGAAALALTVAAVTLRIRPSFVNGWRLLLRERHAMGNSVTMGAIAVAGASLVIAAATAHFLSTAAAGSLRGASTAMGPLNVLLAFIALNLTPSLLRRERSQDLGFCVRVALLAAAAAVVWSAALLLLPNEVGRAVLGESWPGARSVLPWTCAEYLFLCISTPSMLWLRVRYAARQMLKRRLFYAGLLVCFGVVAAILGSSAQYVAAAIAGAALLNVVTGWTVVLRNRSLDFTPASAGMLARSTDQT